MRRFPKGDPMKSLMIVCGALLTAFSCNAQVESMHALPSFPMREDGPVLRQHVEAGQPFTVAGPEGVIVGQQQGTFEAWVLPVKLLSHLTIEAQVEGYDVPIDLNAMAREIEVRPDRTTITYAHIALTMRQIMFAPQETCDGTGVVVLFEVDSLHPVDLIFRFTGDMRNMWPEPSYGTPSAEWVAQEASGFYVLHTDSPALAGAIALPGATHGIMAPYQERPQVYPLELRLHVDPKNDRGRLYPLLMAVARTKAMATNEALEGKLVKLDDAVPELYEATAKHARDEEERLTSIADFGWAETSIGQLRTKVQGSGEEALVAGYYASCDSARPGFGWFFGRDALYTLYAIDSEGDFALSRKELEFLLHRQREDGKIMHEYSQTAADVDWLSYPYEYAAADATPLFLTAMLDYVRSSGDVAFLRDHRDAVLRAWRFETTHDSDGDGVYDNAQGTGWVESWPLGMPRQEIYLALLDEQASRAVANLAGLLGDASLADAATRRAGTIHKTIEREYYQPATGTYAFSHHAGDKADTTSTIFPAIAWWNGDEGLEHPEASMKAWASPVFDTDWGLRDVSEADPLYDSMSYHQGSVWPLFTGWQSMAEYRSGHPLAGYQSVMQNADLTTAQDLGAVTELLSGDFFVSFGRSTSHQLWSSAMVITPVMRGLFGIEIDGAKHSMRVTPHLPADWLHAEVRHVHVGDAVVNLTYQREGDVLSVRGEMVSGSLVHLEGAGKDGILRVPLPAVEVSMSHGLPLPGARTTHVKIIDEMIGANSLRLELEGLAGTEIQLQIQRNAKTIHVSAEGAMVKGDVLKVHFAEGAGYVSQAVTLHW
jgi:hypothetical protein